MARTIITHVGTSTLNEQGILSEYRGLKILRNTLQDGREPGDDKLGECVKIAREALTHTWTGRGTAQHKRERSHAEIASLSLLKLQPDDRVVLLHSDTPAGRFCARLLEQLLKHDLAPESEYPCCRSGIMLERKQVDRLHVGDGVDQLLESFLGTEAQSAQDTFIRYGLTNYVRLAVSFYKELLARQNKEHRSSENEQPIRHLLFNVTAGYKGMIPIARDLTLLIEAHNRKQRQAELRKGYKGSPIVQCEICYLFERSSNVIYYAALPIAFDFTAFDLDLLERAGSDKGIPHTKPQPLIFYVETNDGIWMRSPLGEVVWTFYEELYKEEQRERTKLPDRDLH